MTLISLDSISKSLGEGPLFSGVTLTIEEGERIGFVGPNGCGKSTLLRILASRMEADEGSIARKKSLRVNMLDQTPEWADGDTIRDFLFRSDDRLVRLVDRYERSLADPASPPALIADLSHQMEHSGGFSLEHRFSSLLSELKIHDLSLPMDELSGGMAKKAALARTLAPDSDLVLLDEPTNHLDLDTIEWLEKRLVQTGKAFVMVTHDRWFLDAVCTVIIDIDGGRVNKYPGDYSEFLERVAQRQVLDANRERRREAILRVELEWLKRGPKARGGKDKKRQERIRNLVAGRPGAAEVSSEAFRTTQRRLGGKVLAFENLTKSWGAAPIIDSFSYILSAGERVGIVGPNGSGKTTLLDLIARRTSADAGRITQGETVRIGYFDQTGSDAEDDLSLLEYVRKAAERVTLGTGVEVGAEQFLERFAFPRPMQGQSVGSLSGGERRRLLLVRLLIAAPNVLLLDEPTNDFDIPTIALLEDFLASFTGCVVVVSHDRAFLEGVADALWVLDGSGKVTPFVGTYTAWRENRGQATAAVPRAEAAASPAAAAPRRAAKGGLSFKEKQELEALLPEIDALEAEKGALEASFADPAAGLAKDGAAFSAATRRYQLVGELITAKTQRWEALAARSD